MEIELNAFSIYLEAFTLSKTSDPDALFKAVVMDKEEYTLSKNSAENAFEATLLVLSKMLSNKTICKENKLTWLPSESDNTDEKSKDNKTVFDQLRDVLMTKPN